MFHIVILSEAKLQRSGQSPRGQAFNLGSILDRFCRGEMDRDVSLRSHDNAAILTAVAASPLPIMFE
jgi:hypothetical protein